MNGLRTFVRQVGYEQRSFWRNPAAASFTFAFPLLFLVVFIALNGNDTVSLPGGKVKFAQFYVPAIVAFGVISACYTNLAFTLAIRRDSGLLKRVRSTPLAPSMYLTGLAGNVVVVSIILTALVSALGIIAYGVSFPGRYLGLVVDLAVGAFAFSALGAMVATFVPNEDAAPAIINFVVFPLLFISGTFGKVAATSTLGRIASVFPVFHLNKLLESVFNPNAAGTGIIASHVAVLLAWGLGSLFIAARRFRWEPVTADAGRFIACGPALRRTRTRNASCGVQNTRWLTADSASDGHVERCCKVWRNRLIPNACSGMISVLNIGRASPEPYLPGRNLWGFQ